MWHLGILLVVYPKLYSIYLRGTTHLKLQDDAHEEALCFRAFFAISVLEILQLMEKRLSF